MTVAQGGTTTQSAYIDLSEIVPVTEFHRRCRILIADRIT